MIAKGWSNSHGSSLNFTQGENCQGGQYCLTLIDRQEIYNANGQLTEIQYAGGERVYLDTVSQARPLNVQPDLSQAAAKFANKFSFRTQANSSGYSNTYQLNSTGWMSDQTRTQINNAKKALTERYFKKSQDTLSPLLAGSTRVRDRQGRELVIEWSEEQVFLDKRDKSTRKYKQLTSVIVPGGNRIDYQYQPKMTAKEREKAKQQGQSYLYYSQLLQVERNGVLHRRYIYEDVNAAHYQKHQYMPNLTRIIGPNTNTAGQTQEIILKNVTYTARSGGIATNTYNQSFLGNDGWRTAYRSSSGNLFHYETFA